MSNVCSNCFSSLPDDAAVCPECGYAQEKDKGKYPQALPAGTVLNGRFILGRVLGQGGFGITYVAKDHKTGGLVAVKEYFPDTFASRTANYLVSPYSGQRAENFAYGKECFLNEAKTLAEFIGNPNIVRVYSYFEENNTGYFVMDYIKGISFGGYLKKHGRVSWEEAKRLLFPIMDALSEVHARGIIHRDVTPDNIYICEDGTMKLLDFGAARYSLGDRSRTLDVVLKPGFAPKEQYSRHGRQGPYTDVYSMAATFYYSITGRLPPDSIDRQDNDELILPSSLGVEIPVQAEDALCKGLSVQASDRFQSMNEFKQALFKDDKIGILDGRQSIDNEINFSDIGTEDIPYISPSPSVNQNENNADIICGRKNPEFSQDNSAENVKKKKKGKSKILKRLLAICTPVAAVLIALAVIINNVIIPNIKYETALELMDTGKYEEAAKVFEELGGYSDSDIRLEQCNFLNLQENNASTISTQGHFSVGLKSNGTVVAVGSNSFNQGNVRGWSDIVSVSAGSVHTLGLKYDGMVVVTGDNGYGQCDVKNWKDIVSISAGGWHSVGLKSDGTVVAVGDNENGQCNVSSWKNIVSVSGGFYHTVGLRKDGTVVAVGSNENGQCDVEDWRDIVAVAAGGWHTVGLKSDGTVVAAGLNSDGRCDVNNWTDIVSVSAGNWHTVGLRSDGTVLAVGENGSGQCDVDEWSNIAAVSAGREVTVGLKQDGTAMAVGNNEYEQCNVEEWKNLKIPKNSELE